MAVEISMYVIWAVVVIAALAIEIHTLQQIGSGAVVGAVGALIAHAITKGDPIYIELVTFIGGWGLGWVLFFLLFKFVKVHDKEDGYMAYINKEFIAIKSNSKGHGSFKDNDKVFRFISDQEINKGDVVIIKSFKGVTAIVSKKGDE